MLTKQPSSENTEKATKIVRELRDIIPDYAFKEDIMSEEDERLAAVKKIVNTKLSQADRAIILMYADCGSLRKVAARLNVSHMTLHKQIKRIKKIILTAYENKTF